jgi:hypothetical protein
MLEAGYSLLPASFPFSYWTLRYKWKRCRIDLSTPQSSWYYEMSLPSICIVKEFYNFSCFQNSMFDLLDYLRKPYLLCIFQRAEC